MLPTEQPKFYRAVTDILAAYVKTPTPAELESWWAVCKVFSLQDVERALAAHQMDPDDGKRPPRPIDVKRRLISGVTDREAQRYEPADIQRLRDHYERSIRSPVVRDIAWDIAKRHGNRPWQGTYASPTTSAVVEKAREA